MTHAWNFTRLSPSMLNKIDRDNASNLAESRARRQDTIDRRAGRPTRQDRADRWAMERQAELSRRQDLERAMHNGALLVGMYANQAAAQSGSWGQAYGDPLRFIGCGL